MEFELIDEHYNVLEISLLNLGFNKLELNKMIEEQILVSIDNDCYKVLNKGFFKLMVLKKLLEFERKIITDDELDYIKLPEIDRKRLFAYGIGKRLDSDRIEIVGNIEDISKYRDEIDWYLYYQLYEKYLKQGEYSNARASLIKYIEICEAFGFIGDYYYKLSDLNNLIFESRMDYTKLSNYCSLKEELLREKETGNRYSILKAATNFNYFAHSSYSNLEAGISLLKVSDYKNAVNCLKHSLKHNPKSPLPYKYLSMCYTQIKDYNNALSTATEYIQLDKNTRKDGYVQLFNIYLLMDKIDLAQELFNYCIGIIDNPETLKWFVNSCKKKCIQKISRCVKSKNMQINRSRSLFELLNSITKEIDFKEEYLSMEQEILNDEFSLTIEKFLKPNSDKIVETKKIDEYISNLKVDDEKKNILLLKACLVLASNNYLEKSNEYLKNVEKIKNKSDFLKKELLDTKKNLKLIKFRHN